MESATWMVDANWSTLHLIKQYSVWFVKCKKSKYKLYLGCILKTIVKNGFENDFSKIFFNILMWVYLIMQALGGWLGICCS